jgi:hypothetical protein
MLARNKNPKIDRQVCGMDELGQGGRIVAEMGLREGVICDRRSRGKL